MYMLALNIDKAKKIYVCFRFPDPTYVFGPTLNILLCWKKKKRKKKKWKKKNKEKNKCAVVTKHTAQFFPCGPFLFRFFVVPITGRLALKFKIFVTSFRLVSSFYFLKSSQNFCDWGWVRDKPMRIQ